MFIDRINRKRCTRTYYYSFQTFKKGLSKLLRSPFSPFPLDSLPQSEHLRCHASEATEKRHHYRTHHCCRDGIILACCVT